MSLSSSPPLFNDNNLNNNNNNNNNDDEQQQQLQAQPFDNEIELTLDENLAQQLISSNEETSVDQQQTPTKTTKLNFLTQIKNFSIKLPTNENCSNDATSVTSTQPFHISFLLAVFDNIVGPKCIHFWSSNSSKFDNHLLKYIAVHTLNGELYNQEKLFNSHKYRYYVITEINYAILSVFFDANTIQTHQSTSSFDMLKRAQNSQQNNLNNSHKSTILNCFSIIVPIQYKHYLLDNHKFFLNSIENFVIEYKVYAEIWDKVDHITLAINYLTKCVNDLCKQLLTLQTRGLKSISLRNTYLHDNDNSIDKEFLACALTSHFLTNMNSIVIGKSSLTINKMICTLAYFMPKEKRLASCYSLPDHTSLSSYFYVQGFVSENPNEFEKLIDADLLLNKTSPTTIIDLDSKQVYRTPLLDDYVFIRESYLGTKVKYLYNSLKLEDLLKEWTIEIILQKTNTNSRSHLIMDMLKQIELLDAQFGVRESYLSLFMKDLYVSALTLIEYVNNEIIKTDRKDKIATIVCRKLLKELDYKNEEDLHLLIGYADQLKCDFSKSFILK